MQTFVAIQEIFWEVMYSSPQELSSFTSCALQYKKTPQTYSFHHGVDCSLSVWMLDTARPGNPYQ